jgi:uncharacterized membrane protein (DUF485 family)
MGHGPAVKLGVDNASGYKTKLGIWLFLLYSGIYAVFVGINVVDPSLMGSSVMGQTMAVGYGIGLIVFAFVLAIIYNRFCTKAEERMNPK